MCLISGVATEVARECDHYAQSDQPVVAQDESDNHEQKAQCKPGWPHGSPNSLHLKAIA